MVDAQGSVVSSAPVNAANGAVTLPPTRIPMQANFRACIQSQSSAQICSDPGALSALSAITIGSGPARGIPAEQASPLSAADAAVLARIQIVKAPTGWKCSGAGGKPCSDTEAKLMQKTSVTKSRSNVKDNLTIGPAAPDGTFQCFKLSDNRPCSDAEIEDIAAEIKRLR